MQGDAYGENEGLVIYSTKEDRFTVCDGEDIRLPGNLQDFVDPEVIASLQKMRMAELTTRGNVVSDETHHLRGIWAQQVTDQGATYDLDISRFSREDEPQPGFMVTNSYSAATFPEVNAGKSVEIQMIRPIYRTEGNGTDPVELNMDIWIAYADSPDMRDFQFDELKFDDVEDKWWLPGGIVVGQYFKFFAVLYSTQPTVIKEFIGLEIKYKPLGDFS